MDVRSLTVQTRATVAQDQLDNHVVLSYGSDSLWIYLKMCNVKKKTTPNEIMFSKIFLFLSE